MTILGNRSGSSPALRSSAPAATRRLLSSRLERNAASRNAASLSAAQKHEVQQFRARLETGDYALVHEDCPCGLTPDDRVIAEVDRYGLELDSVLCLSCGTIRIDPYLDDDSLDHFYRNVYQVMYARATDLPAYFERQRAYGEKLLETYRATLAPGSTVLEVGCGAGGALNVFQQAGFESAGCDYSGDLIAYGSHRGVRSLFVGALDDSRVSTGRSWNFIYLHHVFEHVTNPLELLRNLKRCLAPGGRALIIVPDIRRIDRFANPCGDALQFFHIAHKYNYSLQGLRRLGARAALSVRSVVPDSRIPTVWSTAPELWVELTSNDTTPSADQRSMNERPTVGHATYRYLRFTETCFRAGLCRAQLLQRFDRVTRTLRS